MEHDFVGICRLQPDESSDHQIAETRVEIMFAVVVPIMTLKGSGVRMKGFGQIRFPFLAMRLGIDIQESHIIFRPNKLGVASLQDVRECFERLRGRVRPGLTTPPTTTFLEKEHRIIAFDRCWAIVGKKPIRVHELGPSHFVGTIGL